MRRNPVINLVAGTRQSQARRPVSGARRGRRKAVRPAVPSRTGRALAQTGCRGEPSSRGARRDIALHPRRCNARRRTRAAISEMRQQVRLDREPVWGANATDRLERRGKCNGAPARESHQRDPARINMGMGPQEMQRCKNVRDTGEERRLVGEALDAAGAKLSTTNGAIPLAIKRSAQARSGSFETPPALCASTTAGPHVQEGEEHH